MFDLLTALAHCTSLFSIVHTASTGCKITTNKSLLFQTLCLHKGVANQVGGATPGKRIMGLRVVSCVDVIEVGENRVRVAPAANIGFTKYVIQTFTRSSSLVDNVRTCFGDLHKYFYLHISQMTSLACKILCDVINMHN